MTAEITLTRFRGQDIAAAYRTLGMRLRAQAADVEATLAYELDVRYGHPSAQNEESRLLREAAAACDDLIGKLESMPYELHSFDAAESCLSQTTPARSCDAPLLAGG